MRVGRTGHGRKEGLIVKKKKESSGVSMLLDWGEGGEVQVSAWRGVWGKDHCFTNIRRSIQGPVDIKPRCLPWRGGCKVPAGAPLWIPLWFWRVRLHGAISLREHTPNTPLTESPVLSVFSFLSQASACLFRHVQLSGLKDCSATRSIPSCFTIRGQMSGRRWP